MLRFRALLRSPHVKAPLLRAAVARMSTTPPTTPHPYESFLSGTSANYVDDMYESWQQDPAPQRRAKSGLFTARVSVRIEVRARGLRARAGASPDPARPPAPPPPPATP